MPNPKAPRVFRQPTSPEVVSELDGFLARLARLGADDDALAQVRDGWDDFDEDWTPERRADVVAASDTKLRRMLHEVDDEYEAGTTADPDGALAGQAEGDYQAALTEARARIGQAVPALLAWVADDPTRAAAVVAAEREQADAEGRPVRTTLVGPLSG